MKVFDIIFILLSLGLLPQNSYALKAETLLELMNSNKDNPSLSKLHLPSGEHLLDRKKPYLKKRDRKEHPSLVIYVVRHGEKYFDDRVGKLNAQGWERAFALAPQMSLDPFFRESYDDLEIIAADSPDGSREPSRYIETAIPFAFLQNKQIKAFYTHAEYKELANYIKTNENKRIFIFWEHKHMHNLLRALGFDERDVPYYPTEDFGQVWKITNLNKLDLYAQNLMFDDAFNYTKEEILEHSLQVPTPKKYPHGDRYEVSLSLSPRNKAAITCRPDSADGSCQDFNFIILDYDADAFNYIDGYIETNQSFSIISGDVPCQDTEPMIDWLTKTIDNNAGSLSDADSAYICSLGPVGPTRTQMTLVGLGSQLCEDMRRQLLDDCAKSARLSDPTKHLGNTPWPIVYNTLGFAGIALGIWAVKKCIKKSGKQGQYLEIPKTEG